MDGGVGLEGNRYLFCGTLYGDDVGHWYLYVTETEQYGDRLCGGQTTGHIIYCLSVDFLLDRRSFCDRHLHQSIRYGNHCHMVCRDFGSRMWVVFSYFLKKGKKDRRSSAESYISGFH